MHQDDHDIGGFFSLDHDSGLCEQQTVLLNRIDALTHDAAIHNLPNSGDIYTLKQEYNRLVNKRTKLARTPLSDPTEVLPSELWPDIIRNIVGDPRSGPRCHMNELLDLTSVSKGWCSLFTTLPVIWTEIWLDQREPDYLAKAMMCIQLSRECEIDLSIWHLTADEWRAISSMIVSEGRRIRRLSFIMETDYMLTRQVLGDFIKLPVLKELSLSRVPGQLSDQQYILALLKEKMPSIKMVDTPEHNEIWNPYLTRCYLQGGWRTKDTIERLALVPHLHSLTFMETDQTLKEIPSLLKSSFGSVTYFMYQGADICRRLTWIGSNLSTLSTNYPENGDAKAFLIALSRFPQLHELTIILMASSWGQNFQNNSHTASPHNSIRALHFKTPLQDQSNADWDIFFSIFFPASPCLEILTVFSGLITDMGWNSIRRIKNLRYLQIGECNINDASSISLNMESLRHFVLMVHPHGLAQVLAKLQSKFLRTLRLTERNSYAPMATTPCIAAGAGVSLPIVTTTPSIVAGGAFPSITSLVISASAPVMWELRALSKLREIELQGGHMSHWVSDVLEAILMRPRDNPALEKITLTCDFVEWDILILMLERRNFLNEPGISSIKTLVFTHGLPYRLLYPLSELLGGRFVERDSNRSFSLEAIGERMFNESLPGCMRCYHSFRECEPQLASMHYTHSQGAVGGDKANEHLVADPPLPLEMTFWLSGRRERLINFVWRYEETGRLSHRPPWCNATGPPFEAIGNATRPPFGGIAITGSTLVGAHFGRDLQE